MHLRALALLLLVVVLLSAGCRDRSPPTATAATAAATTDKPTAPGTTALPGLCLYDIRVESLQADDKPLQRAVVARGVIARLLDAGPFAGVDGPAAALAGPDARRCPSTLSKLARTGVAFAVVLASLNGEGLTVKRVEATQIGLRAQVHAERGDAAGRPVLGEASVEAPLPPPQDRSDAAFARFATARAIAAVALAATDAAGQLLSCDLSDENVLAWLEDDAAWHTVAALREVGERGLAAARERVEALAKKSRPDIAAVAAATLGRLGDQRSVAVLRLAAEHSAVEVADAALIALADIGGAAAWQMVADAASHHPQQWIRQRAQGLLERRPAAETTTDRDAR